MCPLAWRSRVTIHTACCGRFFLTVLLLLTFYSVPVFAQTAPERFWVAGRYDGNRIIVYFDAVKFGNTSPSPMVQLTDPIADGFLIPFVLPAKYTARFQKRPNAEHFAIGDRYDLLLGRSGVVTVTLSTLVGSEGDEGVGNDSFIGALGTLDNKDGFSLPKEDYYVVRRHRESTGSESKLESRSLRGEAGLRKEPVRFDIQTQIASLLKARMKLLAPGPVRLKINNEKIGPAFTVQPFTVADGTLRYYIRAEWKSESEVNGDPTYTLAAWMEPLPKLHILAVQRQTSPYGFESGLPVLQNVVDLGGGKTGAIIALWGVDSAFLNLVEYRDGVGLEHMRVLQSIGASE